jgi:hypothetical protein
VSPTAHTVARARWAVRVALRLALLAALLMLAWTVYDEVGAHRSNRRSIAVLASGGTPPGGPSVFRFLDTTWQWLMIAALLLAADLFALRLLVPRSSPGSTPSGRITSASSASRTSRAIAPASSPIS